ncbi:Bromodomain-containing protein [Rhodocollybia butyracea]|uniref:histone acetyltransferase n=1 Tax=Rhodocollybia butyracea TaxID=206335 RepID=A0A9P5P7P5_9AGAR|nr:Bromodomain-containing protein [Rhodocollybia butyracea]KAF9062422.1 Bromodomain-containing protein [Rhodocollybia butyracea]
MPVANGKTSGFVEPEPRIKLEEKLDDAQLDRLATGVPVDSETTAVSNCIFPPVKTEKAATVELRRGIIRVLPVANDRLPRSMILMTGLKTLFQKQLPKMPRDYIARLVYDDNSRALAIVKRGQKVVGGICFRPFPHRGFAEIVFFATASVDQVKGYGGMLMDHFKMHVRRAYPGMNHFLTYADNYAVGYFEKQGFSKEITLERSVWAGYIKDYEGGTIMQCTMLDKVDYLDKTNILAQQQEAIMAKIRQMSQSHIVHPGLPQFQEGAPQGVTVDPQDVPGLRETGWTPSMAENLARLIPKSPDRHFMDRLLKDLQEHNQAWPFLLPVPAEDVPDYYDVILHPMDFSTMEHKLDNNQYPTVEDFVNDARLVFNNCRSYNQEDSVYHKCANSLEKFVNEQLKDRTKREV